MTRLASPNVHRLPKALRTEYVQWTGGNRNRDIEGRIRRVWAEDSLRRPSGDGGGNGGWGELSKVLVFCNKRSKVQELAGYLEEKGIRCVGVTGQGVVGSPSGGDGKDGEGGRRWGSNHHLDGFLRVRKRLGAPAPATQLPATTSPTQNQIQTVSHTPTPKIQPSKDPKKTPHVLITTSLLSRGLDFAPEIKHVFIVDEPRNMLDFLHRAGRSARMGSGGGGREKGTVVVFGKMEGRGSGRAKEVRKSVGALRA